MKRLLILLALLAFASARAADRPNIIFIFSDDHAQHAISAYGSKVNQTPHLDRLAKEGARFTRSFCINSICTPSRATLLTGQYSHINGVPVFNRFDGARDHFAKHLQKGGYHTGIIGKWHLGSDPTGFDRWLVLPGQGAYWNPVFLAPDRKLTLEGHCTDLTTELGLEFIKTRPKDKPFFLMLHQKAPHRAWEPATRHVAMFKDKVIPEPATLFDDYATRPTALPTNEQTIARDLSRRDLKLAPPADLKGPELQRWLDAAPEELEVDGKKLTGKELVKWKYQKYMRDYLGCAQGVDDSVGQVLDYLDATGLATNTIVIYSSDNGWFLGDLGLYDKRFMYEPGLNVPLLARGPGIKAGITPAQFVSNLDLAPTFLDLAGLPVPDFMQGRSLAPLLRGEAPQDWRTSIYYRYYHSPGHHNTAAHFGVRTATHKLIHYWKQDAYEMFDLAADPTEQRNLLYSPADATKPEVAAKFAELKAELARLQKEFKDDGLYADPATWPSGDVDASLDDKPPSGKKTVAEAIALSIPTLITAMPMTAAVPLTEKKPVTDEYHGVKVVDDYRWLEETGSPTVKAWTDAQNKHSRAWLDGRAERAGIEAKLTALYAKDTPSHGGLVSRPGLLFALKFQPPKQQRLLVSLASVDDLASERVVLDPNELEPKGQVAMDWFVPSPDGKLIAVCLSEHGSEDGTLHFFRPETGERLPDRLARVQYPTGGGSAAWMPDSSGVFYSRYPHQGEKPEVDLNFFQQIYFHKLGTPAEDDEYSAGRDFPRIAEIELETSKDGRWLHAAVANGDGGEFSHHVRETKTGAAWRQIARHEDGVKSVVFSHDGTALFLRSVKDAPRGKVLRMPTTGTLRDAVVVVPESEAVIEGITATAQFLFVADMLGGPSRVRQFTLDGKDAHILPLPEASGVGGMLEAEGRIVFRQTSFVAPAAWMAYDPASGTMKKTALFNTSPVDFSDIETVREFAVSKDSTKVPVNILRRKGTKLDGSNPTLLYAYGGYGHCMTPFFDFENRLWFDRGGIYVVANIRGGGEYGEEWHLAGNLTKKQNVFDDFAACAQHLIARGYTRPEKLAVEGRSNGGLLMGAFLTQHPALARAVVAHVGLYDMLRVELDPNGAFNVTEFGTVKDPAQFRALHAYSPFHNVQDGTKYPAVFFLAGETDGRVNPAHSRRMTGRLQAATASKNPILVRLNSSSGHGMGTGLSEKIAQQADVFAFLFDQLGMAAK